MYMYLVRVSSSQCWSWGGEHGQECDAEAAWRPYERDL